jgi:DNA adenine methylase
MRVRVSPPAPSQYYLRQRVGSISKEPETLKPPLKWAGGKRWLLPHVAAMWRRHEGRRYVEPFCGGLAVALGLQPERALLNDVNPHLINFYQQVRRGLALTIKARYDRELFYQHRDRFNNLVKQGRAETKEAAQLFYYLNRTGFNGLCRFNLSGEFNVPFGRYATVNYATDFHTYRKLFRRWSFTSKDLADLPLEPDDFIYADPPYDVEFTTYSAGGFTWHDQVRTAELLARHLGPVALSNQATKRIVKLYRQLGFDLKILQAPRRISSNGNREDAKEVLATKNLK